MADRCPKCSAKGFESCVAPCAACGWQDSRLGNWVPSGYYEDPANPGKTRFWDQRRVAWVGKPDAATPPRALPPEPVDWNQRTAGAVAVVRHCVVLGGYGFELVAGTPVLLCFRDDEVDVWTSGHSRLTFPFATITECAVESWPLDEPPKGSAIGNYLIGGELGGMELNRLNQILASTNRMTLVRIVTDTMEMFVHATADRPLALRMALSESCARIRAARALGRAEIGRLP